MCLFEEQVILLSLTTHQAKKKKKERDCLNKQISQNSSVPLIEEGQALCYMAPKMDSVNSMNKCKYR